MAATNRAATERRHGPPGAQRWVGRQKSAAAAVLGAELLVLLADRQPTCSARRCGRHAQQRHRSGKLRRMGASMYSPISAAPAGKEHDPTLHLPRYCLPSRWSISCCFLAAVTSLIWMNTPHTCGGRW